MRADFLSLAKSICGFEVSGFESGGSLVFLYIKNKVTLRFRLHKQNYNNFSCREEAHSGCSSRAMLQCRNRKETHNYGGAGAATHCGSGFDSGSGGSCPINGVHYNRILEMLKINHLTKFLIRFWYPFFDFIG
jgi:hypothetical protein